MNIIVPCGTSQTDKFIDDVLLGYLGIDLAEVGYAALGNYFQSDPDPILNGQFPADMAPAAENIAINIVNYIQKNAQDLQQIIGTDHNPLGAELSTLLVYFGYDINQHDHTFHILRSDTYLGWFNAEVLSQVLVQLGWENNNTVQLLKISNLREQLNPQNIDPLLVLGRTLQHILSELIDAKIPDQPLMVVSGGFKSILPCLTVYSILFALKMVYLFEKSSSIVEISTITDITDEKKVRDLWNKMAHSGIADSVAWFKEALTLIGLQREPLPWIK